MGTRQSLSAEMGASCEAGEAAACRGQAVAVLAALLGQDERKPGVDGMTPTP